MALPYRADHVGSLLRPANLLQAREDFRDNRISADQLRQIEDEAVLKALDLQREVGIDIFTEGEYRRSGWSNAVRESVEGLVAVEGSPITGFLGQWQGPYGQLAASSMTMTGMVAGARLKQVRRLAGTEAAFLKKHAPGPWKITMPGAMSSAGQLFKPGVADKVYPTRQALAWDIVPMMRAEIAALQDEGCPYIHLDSLHYVERVADRTIRAAMIE